MMRQALPLPIPLPRSDRWLWLAVAVLVPLGVLMVYSASLDGAHGSASSAEALRQGAYAVLGLAAMLVAARVDYRLLAPFAAVVYGFGLLLLAAVLVIGVSEHGAQRWLGAAGITVQPSEFAKLALAVALAAYASHRQPRPAALAVSLALTAVPMALVALQPDLGTVIVLAGIWLLCTVAWGVSWRTLGAITAVLVALVPLLFIGVPAYQRERLAVFLDPNRDPLGSGFNLRQVEVALGTGGVTGHGLFSGAESHLDAVSARSSDFMFGFLGAELGLLGGLLLIALLATVVTRGFAASTRAPDTFGRLLAVSLTATVLVQGVVNIAVNLRLLPTTGIPLPFISQGGSALVVMLVAVGLLQSIAARRPASSEEQWRAERWR
ncbi:MAG: FtsW/RodA/SpoVE family cell cycle protein [Dehalococcoidia bacterium]